jgi:hypothetical protein
MMAGAFTARRKTNRGDARPAFARGGRARKPPGFFLGGLFSASPATSSSSTKSSQTTSYDPQYTDYFHNILNESTNLYGEMKDKTSADAVEGFTGDQTAAQQGVRDNQGSYQPYFNAASDIYGNASTAANGVGTAGAGAFANAGANPGGSNAAQPYFDQASGRFTDPGVSSSYMSPYLDSVAANTMRLSNQNLMENILPGVNDTFSGGTMGAQFGRERHADITGRAIRDQQNTLTGNLANIYNTGFGNAQGQYNADQSRLGGLGTAAGSLANSTIGAFGNLAGQQTNAAAQGVSSQLGVGGAQQNLGANTQTAGYGDTSQLAASGATQQGLEQQKKTFDMQYPWQLLQTQQGLGQGWQVGSTTTGQSTSNSTSTPASGSVAGGILGAGLSIAGLGTGGGSTLGGGFLNSLFSSGGRVGQGPQYARGGRVGHFAAGGYAPLVMDARATMQRRMPAMQQRMQAMQGGAPGGPQGGLGAMPQRPAFARGGSVHYAAGGFQDDDYGAELPGEMSRNPFGPPTPPRLPQMAQQQPAPLMVAPPAPLITGDEKGGGGGGGGGMGDIMKMGMQILPFLLSRGGAVDDRGQDRRMVTKAVHEHERHLHRGERMTPLQLAAGGYADGYDPIGEGERTRGWWSPFLDAQRPPERCYYDADRPMPWGEEDRAQAQQDGHGFFDRAADVGRGAWEGTKDIMRDIPDGIRREVERYRQDPLGHAADVIYPWTPQGMYGDMVDSSRAMFDPESDWLDRALGGVGMGLNLAAVVPGARWAGRLAGRMGGR